MNAGHERAPDLKFDFVIANFTLFSREIVKGLEF